jgi:hypothetical protein
MQPRFLLTPLFYFQWCSRAPTPWRGRFFASFFSAMEKKEGYCKKEYQLVRVFLGTSSALVARLDCN